MKRLHVYMLAACLLYSALTAPAALAEKSSQIWELSQKETPNTIKMFEKLTNMDSGSHDLPEIAAFQKFVAERLTSMGGTVTFIPAAAPRQDTFNMTAVWKGTGKAKILILGHLDTVWPKGEAAKRPFRIENNMGKGPGTSDMRIGLALGMSAIDLVVNQLKQRDFGQITLLLNCDEEIGSHASKDLIMELAKQHDMSFSLENGNPDGKAVKTATLGGAFANIIVKGRKAHPAVNPEQGRNAMVELAHQIVQLSDLNDYAQKTYVNWVEGVLPASGSFIPDSASAKLRINYASNEEFKRIEAIIRERIANKRIPDCEVTVEFTYGRPAHETTPEVLAIAEKAKQYFAEVGQTLVYDTAGGNDTCYAGLVTPALEGLGGPGGKLHTVDEFVVLDILPERLYMLSKLISEASKGNVLPIGTRDAKK